MDEETRRYAETEFIRRNLPRLSEIDIGILCSVFLTFVILFLASISDAVLKLFSGGEFTLFYAFPYAVLLILLYPQIRQVLYAVLLLKRDAGKGNGKEDWAIVRPMPFLVIFLAVLGLLNALYWYDKYVESQMDAFNIIMIAFSAFSIARCMVLAITSYYLLDLLHASGRMKNDPEYIPTQLKPSEMLDNYEPTRSGRAVVLFFMLLSSTAIMLNRFLLYYPDYVAGLAVYGAVSSVSDAWRVLGKAFKR